MARGTRTPTLQRFARGINLEDSEANLFLGFKDDPTQLGAEMRGYAENVRVNRRSEAGRRPGSKTLATGAFVDIAPGGPNLLLATQREGNVVTVGPAGVNPPIYTAVPVGKKRRWVKARKVTWPHIDAVAAQPATDTTPAVDQVIGQEAGEAGPYFSVQQNGVALSWDGDPTHQAKPWPMHRGDTPIGEPSARTFLAHVPPEAAFIAWIGDRMWIASPNGKMYWSEIDDPASFDEASVNAYDEITALGTVASGLLVFSSRDIHIVYDVYDPAIRRLGDQAGTVSPGSVVETDEGCLFVDPQRGVMITNGADVQPLSENILPAFRDLDNDLFQTLEAMVFENRYYLTWPVKTDFSDNKFIFELDLATRGWWRTTFDATDLSTRDAGQNSGDVTPFYCNETGIVEFERKEARRDDAQKFTTVIPLPYFDDGHSNLIKRLHKVIVDGSGKWDVYLNTDYDDGIGELVGTILLGGGNKTFGGKHGVFGEPPGRFGYSDLVGQDSLYTLGAARAFAFTFITKYPGFINSVTMRLSYRKDG